jgi:hypothetical protein
MRAGRFGVAAMVGLAGLWAAAARGDEKKVELTKLPAPVLRAALGAVPGGCSLTDATKVTEAGKITYEVDGTDANGREFEVEVTPDGKVLSVGVEVELAQVPKVVAAALKAKMPRFKPEDVMRVSEGGKVTGYAFSGTGPGGQEMDVWVSADGKTVEEDDD